MLKKILAPILIATTMMMGGCSLMNNSDSSTSNQDKIKNDIEAYLEDKYDEDFTIISLQGKEFLDSTNTATVYAYPTNGDSEEDRFEAERTTTDDGYEYEDSYFGLLIEDEYNERISQVLSNYFDSFEISSSFEEYYFSNEYDNTKTLQDAIDGGADLYGTVSILVAPTCTEDEFAEKVEEFSKQISTLGLPMAINIFYSKSDDLSSFYTNDIDYSISRYMLVKRDLSVDLSEVRTK